MFTLRYSKKINHFPPLTPKQFEFILSVFDTKGGYKGSRGEIGAIAHLVRKRNLLNIPFMIN